MRYARRGQSRRIGQHFAESLDVRSELGRAHCPGGTQFELIRARRSGDVAVADRTGGRHRPTQRRELLVPRFQGIDQPTPRDLGEQRITGESGIDIGLNVGHQPENPVPRLLPVRIVQQDQPPEGVALRIDRNNIRVGMFDLRSDGV